MQLELLLDAKASYEFFDDLFENGLLGESHAIYDQKIAVHAARGLIALSLLPIARLRSINS